MTVKESACSRDVVSRGDNTVRGQGRLVEFNAAGCGHATCAPLAVGTAGLPGTTAAGRPLLHNHTAIAAYGTHLIAFTVN